MEREITLKLSDLRAIFIAGGQFEKENIDFDMDEIEEIEAPDFGDFMEQKFGIKI